MRVHLTDTYVRALTAEEERVEIADTMVPGLRVRVSAGGAKVWTLHFRPKGGALERLKLGEYPAMKLAEARALAKKRRASVQLGGNPAEEMRAERARAEQQRLREERAQKTTISALSADCIEDLTLRPSTKREWTRLAEAEIVMPFGSRQASDITRAEIREWAAAIRDGQRSWRDDGGRAAPYTANRAFELLRRIVSWGVKKDLIPGSQFVGLDLPAKEAQSERVLSRDELRALMRALDACPRELDAYRDLWAIYADAVRLLLFTCVRRSAVLGMRRSELEDLDGDEPRWVVPGGAEGRSKSGRAHVVPLSPQALTVITRRLGAVPGECLFPVNRYKAGEDRPATWPSRFVADLRGETLRQLRKDLKDEAATMERWRVHDLRHAAGTHIREDLKVSSEVVSLLLGHTPPGAPVSRIYNRAELLAERRAALVAWGAWLERNATDETRRASITPMRRRA